MRRYRISSETMFYYSTCTITAWLPVFQDKRYFKLIIDSLNYCRENKGLFLLGYVIMPTHLHLITYNEKNTNLSNIMRDFKKYTSREIRELLKEDQRNNFLKIFKKSALRLKNHNYRVWQDGFHPIALKSAKWFREKMNYMHENPVRKGFVEKPEHWKYSSARNWVLSDDSVITLDKEVLG